MRILALRFVMAMPSGDDSTIASYRSRRDSPDPIRARIFLRAKPSPSR